MVQLTEREGRGRPFVKLDDNLILAPNLRHLNPENVIKKKGKQRATIEVVSDDEEKEKDNIDILPPDSTFIMEPITKKKEIIILEPEPSVPPFVYNPIIDFAGGDNNNNNDDDDVFEYLSSTSTSTRPTASSSSSSSQQQQQDDFFFGSESRIFFSSNNTFKTTSGMGGGGVPDWSAMGGGKHARWTPAVVTK